MGRRGIWGLFRSVRFIFGCGVFLCICGFIAVFAIIAVIQDQQARAAALSAYGQNIIDLCKITTKTTATTGTDLSSITNKIVVLSDDKVLDRVQGALPVSNQAKDKNGLTGVACVSESSVFYNKSTSSNGQYTCTQYQYVDDVYLVDVSTGKTVNYQQFKGGTPADCPSSISSDTSQYGESPAGSLIGNWIMTGASPS